MPSRWIDVFPISSEPLDVGLDENGRIMFAVNVRVIKEPSVTFDAEVKSVLVTAGVSSEAVFVSSKSVMPTTDGPFAMVTVSGGGPGIRTHNVTTGPAYRESTAQVLAVGKTKPGALALAEQAMAALCAVKNQTVG